MADAAASASGAPRLSRWDVAARALAAILGGYAFASVSVVFLSFVLPMPRAEAVMTGPGITNPVPVDLGAATLTTTRTYRVIEIVPQLVG